MKISADKVIYAFSRNNKPVLIVPSGTAINIETLDCFSNQLRNPEDKMAALDWDRINPVTGPIFIEGAEIGDLLKVTINSIELNEKGTIVSGEDFGILGGMLKGSHTRILTIREGKAEFVNDIKIPIRPMIGVIGVAPKGEDINTGTPGRHGGNMDNTMVEQGAILYFNVETPGALFGLGDVHAVMGDGEIGVSGLEIPANINVTLEIIKCKSVEFPMLENNDYWSVIASAKTIDEAVQFATESMFCFLSGKMNLSDPEIAMLMSLVGQLQFCQVVDPLKTVRFIIPKQYLGQIRF